MDQEAQAQAWIPNDENVPESMIEAMRLVVALINKEDRRCPLSDDLIVKELRARGHSLRRRRVTQVRRRSGIPSSRQRKLAA